MNQVYKSLLFTILLCAGCERHEKHNVLTRYNGYLAVHEIQFKGEIVARVSIDDDGNIISISNSIDEMTQIVDYHPTSQYVLGKAIRDSSSEQQGVAYFFNKENELLHGVFKYKNNLRVGDGFSFYDGMNAVKQYMFFDSTGSIVHRRTYNELGEHIVTEGVASD